MYQLFNPENKFWNFIAKITDVACMSILSVSYTHLRAHET